MTKTVNITRPFTLNLGDVPREDGESIQDYTARAAAAGPRIVTVAAGIQQLPDEVADHWYTKANSVQGQLDPHEYAAQLRAAADAQKTRAEEAAALAEAMDAQASEAESAAEASGKEPGAGAAAAALPVTPAAAPAATEPASDADKTAAKQTTSSRSRST